MSSARMLNKEKKNGKENRRSSCQDRKVLASGNKWAAGGGARKSYPPSAGIRPRKRLHAGGVKPAHEYDTNCRIHGSSKGMGGAAMSTPQKIRVHFKGIGLRVGNKVYAYDPDSKMLGVRFKMGNFTSGWLFKGITKQAWEGFCRDASGKNKLAFWMAQNNYSALVPTPATITFSGIWDGESKQDALPFLDMQSNSMSMMAKTA